MDEWSSVRSALEKQGVAGAEDLGRFVSNTDHFRPSQLDERAALPVLVEVLPTLTDPNVVTAVAGHLRRPWARPAAFESLHAAFTTWAPKNPNTGWHLGDAMANAARSDNLPVLLAIVAARRYGTARQMVVHSLSRFKAAPGVVATLQPLLDDPDVALHAMGALRRTIGPAAALPYLVQIQTDHTGDPIGIIARREARKAQSAIDKSAARRS